MIATDDIYIRNSITMACDAANTILCPGCKIPSVSEGDCHPYFGASPGCWSEFGLLLAREYADPEYMRVHRQTVDAYAAQHPGVSEPRTIQSVNVHLVGLHLVLDRKLSSNFARKVIGIIADDMKGDLRWLDPPSDLGELTVRYVLASDSADQHCARVLQWAESVWQAWAPHHRDIVMLSEHALKMA